MFVKALLSAAAVVAAPLLAQDGACEKLATLSLPDTTITLAQPVRTAPADAPAAMRNLPPYCRVAATLAPSKDSEIKIEVWMPDSAWNGKLLSVGNGGWSGAINRGGLADGIRRGYAAASTDTGHSGSSGSFALGHPEKLIDFAWRSEHEMTVKAKALIAAYYGSGPKLSYWNGCSSGGKQGLKEAQRFPNDYDGIVAGAPANYWTHLMAGTLWVSQTTLKDPAGFIPPAKYAMIHQAALEACDLLDGVKDGVLEDPVRCKFDPTALLCKGEDGPGCLTAEQVESARRIYSGPKNPRTGREIFPGLEPGSERGWGAMAGGPAPFQIPVDHFRFVVFQDPNWDFKTLNFDSDVALADKLDSDRLNATDPNLKDFFAHGGKLLQYHGWNDQLIAPRNSINYYKSVEEKLGPAKLADSYRLFMVPGMGHCGGGDGPNSFDMVSAMEQWVEHSQPPRQIVATLHADDKATRTRPLCPYPQVAQYKGSGSPDDAANFVCKGQ